MAEQAFETRDIYKAPQWLIATNRSGRLEAMKNTLIQLREVDKKIVSIAIVGRCRTGKSYLLNRLANVETKRVRDSPKFKLGSSVTSTTKGIWIWVRPHPRHADQCLLLLDTEGLGDVDKVNRNHDNWIFLTATLLSSALVYNSMGTISEQDMDVISFISHMSDHLSESEKGDNENIDFYFPMLIYAVRDFTLKLIDAKGKTMTQNEYLESALNAKPTKSQKSEEYNAVRRSIRRYFKKRECLTFDVPGPRQVLQNIEKESRRISKNFLSDVEIFTTFLVEKIPVKKTINGKEYYGNMMAYLVERCLAEINSAEVPCIDRMLTQVYRRQNGEMCEQALRKYKEQVKNCLKMPTSIEKLSSVHENSRKDALDFYKAKSAYEPGDTSLYQLNENIDEAYKQKYSENKVASSELCQQILKKLVQDIDSKMRKKVYQVPGGFRKYQEDMESLKMKYNDEEREMGISKSEVLVEFEMKRMEQSKHVSDIEESLQKEMFRKLEESCKQFEIKMKQEEEHHFDLHKKENVESLRNVVSEIYQAAKSFRETRTEDFKALRLEEASRLQREGYRDEAERETKRAASSPAPLHM